MSPKILLLCYGRPDLTEIILRRLSSMRISGVEVVVDGPRSREDKIIQLELLQVLNKFPEVIGRTHIRNRNLGARLGVYKAVSRFLREFDEGIILEDDCLPGFDFMDFATEMLDRYRQDLRVGMISGNNHSGYISEPSYIFSRNKATWGWATWQSRWENFDLDKDWTIDPRLKDILNNMGFDRQRAQRHWGTALQMMKDGSVDAWDWPWFLHLAAMNMLTVTPSVNLVSNIGFDYRATHTRGNPPAIYQEIGALDWPLSHPQTFAPIGSFEVMFERQKYFWGGPGPKSSSWLNKKVGNVANYLYRKHPKFTKLLKTVVGRRP